MRPSSAVHVLRAVMACGAVLACDGARSVSSVCTDEARPSVFVTVSDSASGASLSRGGTTLVLQDGAFVDSLTLAPGAQFSGFTTMNAHERPGTYDVRVRRAGYGLWERAAVRVTADACHVRTVHLEARLQPLP